MSVVGHIQFLVPMKKAELKVLFDAEVLIDNSPIYLRGWINLTRDAPKLSVARILLKKKKKKKLS